MIRSRRLNRRLALLLSALMLSPSSALANPLGGQVVAGQGNIQGQGTATVTVNQQSQNAIFNWSSFSISAGERTQFIQPSASSIALNRVIGPDVSQLYGSLTANGRIFLVNPNGVLIGQGAVINAAGFLATTHDISNADFMAGRYNFNIPGRPDASIVNLGNITITPSSSGFAALVAPGVRNAGVITADLGRVALASGNGFTLDFYGDKLITLQVNDQIASQVIDVATKQPLKSLVSNEGTLQANGGQVALTAVAARAVVDSVINNTGVIEANSVGTKNGMIVLGAATAATKGAGAPTQKVKVSGTLSAKGSNTGEKGGTITVTGESIELASAKLDASGDAGGGTVSIGGKNVDPASTVTIDNSSIIDASALTLGDGGNVTVWSNGSTSVTGTMLATGGAHGGNGGLVETSGQTVNFNGIQVDTSAPNGQTGMWLIDPTDLIVDSAAAATISSNLGTSNVALQTNADGTTSGFGTTQGGPGDIVINAPIAWASANTLALNAYHAIDINAPITVAGAGRLNMTAALDPVLSSVPLISFGSGGNVQFTGTPDSGQSLFINGQQYSLLYSMGDVQGINTDLTGHYALARPLDATLVTAWTPIGTDTGGSVLNGGNGFTGTFQGLGNNISNLTVNLPTTDYVGLFGYIGAGGTIASVGVGGTVVGSFDVGGLVGRSYGTVTQSYATALVTGGDNAGVGGLVGVNFGAVSQSYATGAVSDVSPSSTAVGGLVGNNVGTITQSYATGSASSGLQVGGLVGTNSGTIGQSYATGPVSGTSADNSGVGGLVGYSTGTITQSYASGSVTGFTNVGGLVGWNTGSGDVSQSYATGIVNGTTSVGGLVGWNAGGVNQSYATAIVNGTTSVGGLVGGNEGSVQLSYAVGAVTGSTNVGGLVGFNSGSIDQTYSSGAVSGSENVGGFVGWNGGTINNSYFDTTTSGFDSHSGVGNQLNAQGVSGLTTAQFGSQSSFTGWAFGTTPGGASCGDGACWVIVDTDGSFNNMTGAAGATRPMLLSEWSTTIANPHQLQLIGLDLAAQYKVANAINLGSALANPSDVWGPNGSAGFVPIGQFGTAFMGQFDGAGHVIDGLKMAPTDPSVNSIGLFAANGGVIENVFLTNATISANPNVTSNGQFIGALAGQNFGTINGVWVNGTIDGGMSIDVAIGGLVGQNGMFGPNGMVDQNQAATITNSFALVDVTSHAAVQQSNGNCSPNCQWASLGGLVGQNMGIITQSYASGDIFVGSGGTAGGLVGWNSGSIQYAEALGNVSGDPGSANGKNDSFGAATNLGGLVGQNQNSGSIDSSYVGGNVGTTDAAYLKVGGLVSSNNGTISNSAAFGSVQAGDHSQGGGLVAENNPGGDCNSCGPPGLATITDSFAFGDVTVGSQSIAGGFAATNKGTITASTAGFLGFNYGLDRVYSIEGPPSGLQGGTVSAGDNSIVGGFIAVNDLGGVINNSATFASVHSTGANSIVGGFVGVSGGEINNSVAAAAVTGFSNSYVGGFVGINIGSIADSTVDTGASVTLTGTGNVVGGFVGVNVGAIDPSTTVVTPSAGGGNVVGGFAGAQLDASSFNFGNVQLPAPTFPTGTISGDSTTSDTIHPFIGTTNTSGNPNIPSIVDGCTDSLCQIFLTGFLTAQTNTTTTTNTFNVPPPFQLFIATPPPDNQPTLINLTTGGSGGAGGNGNGDGGNAGGANGNRSPGPPPGPGLGRTLSEQQFSGVPPIGETRFLPGELVMQISDTVSLADVQKIAAQFGITLISSQNIPGRVLYRFNFATNKNIRRLIVALEHNNLVASVQPNYVFGLTQAAPAPAAPAAPRDQSPPPAGDTTGSIPPPGEAAPDLANSNTASLESLPVGDAAQYVIGKLHLGDVHRLARGRNVSVAVIDSEIDARHPDLAGVLAERYDATQSASHPHAHGTGMAGAIASHSRLLGVAPGVRLLAIKAFDESASSAEATSFQILKGLDYAIAKNVRIINMSFAGPRDPMMERTLKTAHDKGIILIAAAGNAGPKSPPLYPGADPSVIAVTATDYTDKPFAMANRGKYVSVAAPGVDVMVPAPGGTYQLTTGTSVAAAHVSGVAALLVERKPTITPDEVRAVLTRTARAFAALPKGELDGAGMVDPVSALQFLIQGRSSEASPPARSASVH